VNAQTKCLSCGGTNLEPGVLRSTGSLHFRPDNAEFLKLKTANADVSAQLCLDCGMIALTADAQKVRSLTGKKQDAVNSSPEPATLM
jgi:predicted nucleic-acid-binding Zn-ribbon protein